MKIEAVVFDLDGVIVESEEIWDDVRERYVRERGGRYDAEAQRAMMGMSSTEWSRFIHEELGVEATPAEINADVVELMAARYRAELPLVPGAREAVERTAAVFPLGLASSSNRPLIDEVLALAQLAELFRATVSSEEVARGKPAPDVYLEAARLTRRPSPSNAPQSRTRTRASPRRKRPGCAWSRSPTAATRRTRLPSRKPTPSSRRSTS